MPGMTPGQANSRPAARAVVIAAITCALTMICVVRPRRPARLFRENGDAPELHTPSRVQRGLIKPKGNRACGDGAPRGPGSSRERSRLCGVAASKVGKACGRGYCQNCQEGMRKSTSRLARGVTGRPLEPDPICCSGGNGQSGICASTIDPVITYVIHALPTFSGGGLL